MHEPRGTGPAPLPAGDVFADVLRDLRTALGLTQERLAERAGLGVRTLQGLERGDVRPLRQTVARLVAGLAPLTDDTARLVAAAPSQARRPHLVRANVSPPTAAPGVAVDLAPLQPARLSPVDLPWPRTSFIGRADEVIATARRMCDPRLRLLTLTGLGGVGKTRLAIESARAAAADFPDGVAFASIEATRDPRALTAAVARALGIQLEPGGDGADELGERLGDRRVLLVADNCEQLGPGAPEFSRLLASCVGLTILATSRTALHLSGEHEHRVEPLALPSIDGTRPEADLIELMSCDAVALFVERARAVRAEFALSVDNAAAVRSVCQLVDGVPLAIELAALRVRVLGPAALARQLEKRLPLLTGGPLDAPARQQTLRATLDWSYRILPADARRLLRCLGACAGATTMSALEAISSATAGGVLNALGTLTEGGLVQITQGGVHDGVVVYMLDTVREYAAERLAASRAGVALRDRHAAYYTALAEREAVLLRGPGQLDALARLELEYANLRAAVLWWIERRQRAPALRLASALCRFWGVRGHVADGRAILAQALALPGHAPTAVCLEAVLSAERLAYLQRDFVSASRLLDQALELGRTLGDAHGTAIILNSCGVVAMRRGELAHARAYHEQNLAVCETLGDARLLAMTQYNLGTLSAREGDLAEADRFLHASLECARGIGDDLLTATNLTALGYARLERGDPAAARAHLRESLSLRRAARDQSGAASAIEGLAVVALEAGERQRAVILWSAAAAVREGGASALPSIEGPLQRAAAHQLRAAEQDPALHNAWADGHAMTLIHAYDYALADG